MARGRGRSRRRRDGARSEADRLRALRSPSQRKKQDAGIWQRRFWEHHTRGRDDLEAHIRYCWSNPVKHGLVARPADWPFSSIHRDIHAGRVDPAWPAESFDGAFGEPGGMGRWVGNPPYRGFSTDRACDDAP